VSTPKFPDFSIIWIFSKLKAKTILEQKTCTDLASNIPAIALIGLDIAGGSATKKKGEEEEQCLMREKLKIEP
jgi:hypothetical protein